MHNLVKYLAIGLLTLSLAACDNSDTKKSPPADAATKNASLPVSLLNGNLTFTLPDGMSDQSGKLGTQANNMHVYSDASGQKAVIVIISDGTNDPLTTLSQRLEQQQRTRDPQLQVVENKSIDVNGHSLQQLDSIISVKGQTGYSSVVLGKINNQLLVMEITLPMDNQALSQKTAQSIIDTITIKE